MRKLPVYLLVDTSGSMNGEPIQAANNGLQTLVSSLKLEPFALESVYLSIITYDRDAREVLPLTALNKVQVPVLQTPPSGPTMLGKALEMVMEKVNREVVHNTPERKGDWRPLLFVITDGKPSDVALYAEMARKVRAYPFGVVVGCAAGPEAKTEPLKQLTDNVYLLATMDGSSFSQFFKFVSQSIAQGASSQGVGQKQEFLPAPPPGIDVVF